MTPLLRLMPHCHELAAGCDGIGGCYRLQHERPQMPGLAQSWSEDGKSFFSSAPSLPNVVDDPVSDVAGPFCVAVSVVKRQLKQMVIAAIKNKPHR